MTGRADALSVCVLTSGRAPARLAAILRLFRPVADEIVVALDDRNADAVSQLAGVADRIFLFSHAEPGDRPIAWLVGQCRGRWIFNVDDDEVPSARLLAELPEIIRDPDVTHCWIARRWLHPDTTTYLAVPPWSTEFQLRLFEADPRHVRFTQSFHLPITCEGPMRFVDAPLWHLDTALNDFGARRQKALAYERERRGMRIDGFSHNTGLYLPELRDDLRHAPVPDEDRRLIDGVLAAGPADEPPRATVEVAHAADIDAAWPGEPHPSSTYQSSISLVAATPTLIAESQQTLCVKLENRGDEVWRRGAITIGTRWTPGGESVRTQLPADVQAHASVVVPVHVIPPAAGTQLLEIDLVHEGVRWFRTPVEVTVEVAARRRVLVLAGDNSLLDPVLDELALVPAVEPIVIATSAGEHQAVDDLRAHLFGRDGKARSAAVARALLVPVQTRLRRQMPELATALDEAECLILVGDGAIPGAPPTRERLRIGAIVASARAAHTPVLRVAVPSQDAGARSDAMLDTALGRLCESIPLDRLADRLRSAGGGTRTPTPEGRRF